MCTKRSALMTKEGLDIFYANEAINVEAGLTNQYVD
jgi:hypothetical protein